MTDSVVRHSVAIADPENPSNVVKPSTAKCVEITPHATDAIDATSAIQVNVAGDVTMRFEQTSADVTLTLLAGVIYPYRVTHVRVAATTATGIHGFY